MRVCVCATHLFDTFIYCNTLAHSTPYQNCVYFTNKLSIRYEYLHILNREEGFTYNEQQQQKVIFSFGVCVCLFLFDFSLLLLLLISLLQNHKLWVCVWLCVFKMNFYLLNDWEKKKKMNKIRLTCCNRYLYRIRFSVWLKGDARREREKSICLVDCTRRLKQMVNKISFSCIWKSLWDSIG